MNIRKVTLLQNMSCAVLLIALPITQEIISMEDVTWDDDNGGGDDNNGGDSGNVEKTLEEKLEAAKLAEQQSGGGSTGDKTPGENTSGSSKPTTPTSGTSLALTLAEQALQKDLAPQQENATTFTDATGDAKTEAAYRLLNIGEETQTTYQINKAYQSQVAAIKALRDSNTDIDKDSTVIEQANKILDTLEQAKDYLLEKINNQDFDIIPSSSWLDSAKSLGNRLTRWVKSLFSRKGYLKTLITDAGSGDSTALESIQNKDSDKALEAKFSELTVKEERNVFTELQDKINKTKETASNFQKFKADNDSIIEALQKTLPPHQKIIVNYDSDNNIILNVIDLQKANINFRTPLDPQVTELIKNQKLNVPDSIKTKFTNEIVNYYGKNLINLSLFKLISINDLATLNNSEDDVDAFIDDTTSTIVKTARRWNPEFQKFLIDNLENELVQACQENLNYSKNQALIKQVSSAIAENVTKELTPTPGETVPTEGLP